MLHVKIHISTYCSAAYVLFMDVCCHGLGYYHCNGHRGCENKPVWSAWGETDWCGTFSTQTRQGVWFRFWPNRRCCAWGTFTFIFDAWMASKNKWADLKQWICIPGTIKSENYILSSIHQLVEFSGGAASCQFSLCVFNSQRRFEFVISWHHLYSLIY